MSRCASPGFDTEAFVSFLIRALGDTILGDEAHSTPAGRQRAAQFTRIMGEAWGKTFPNPGEFPQFCQQLALACESGKIDVRDLAEELANYERRQ